MCNRFSPFFNRKTDLTKFTSQDVNIYEVEKSLNRIQRFSGGVGGINPSLSVAQHSVLVQRLAEQSGESFKIQLGCILHDFDEATTGDILGPLKRYGLNEKGKTLLSDIGKVYEEVFLNPITLSNKDRATIKSYDVKSFELECLWMNNPFLLRDKMNKEYELLKSVTGWKELVPLRGIYQDLYEKVIEENKASSFKEF